MWNAAAVPPGQRVEAVRELVWRELVAIEIDHAVPAERLQVRARIRDVGRLRLATVRATRAGVRRTAALVRSDERRWVFLSLQVRGSSVIRQHGRSCLLLPGDLALFDTAAPYHHDFGSGALLHHVRIPAEALAVPEPALRLACATGLGAVDELGRATAVSVTRLAEGPGPGHDAAAVALEAPTLGLVRATVLARAGLGAFRTESGRPLPTRIADYVATRLGDPDLSPGRVARAHDISSRYLHQIYARTGTSFGASVRRQRLEASRADLADQSQEDVPIGAIAVRWGFRDPAHFSRAFRETYGVTPREWRRVSRLAS